jgi:hypothetical protein
VVAQASGNFDLSFVNGAATNLSIPTKIY